MTTRRERLRLEKEKAEQEAPTLQGRHGFLGVGTVFTDTSDMHEKFGVHEAVEKLDPSMLLKLLKFRMKMIDEERKETLTAIKNGDAEGVVDGLVDLLVFAVGTLDIMGVDGQVAWDAVNRANMTKEPGVKEGRPNPYGFPDLVKPEGWVGPDHSNNFGILPQVFGEEEG